MLQADPRRVRIQRVVAHHHAADRPPRNLQKQANPFIDSLIVVKERQVECARSPLQHKQARQVARWSHTAGNRRCDGFRDACCFRGLSHSGKGIMVLKSWWQLLARTFKRIGCLGKVFSTLEETLSG